MCEQQEVLVLAWGRKAEKRTFLYWGDSIWKHRNWFFYEMKKAKFVVRDSYTGPFFMWFFAIILSSPTESEKILP